MKDFLKDLVSHTHALGFLPLLKIDSSATETSITAMADDRTVVVNAKTHEPVANLIGEFGMPNLNKLDIHLKCPEYKEDASIDIVTMTKDGEVICSGLHFKNKSGDFQNDYRFMNKAIINDILKSARFKGATWDVTVVPSIASIEKLKFQANANSDETTVQVTTDNNNLIFSFGNISTHAGSFIFAANVTGKLKNTMVLPINQLRSILNLSGDIIMKFADTGALQITIDTGIAEYNYILPAKIK